MSNCLLQNLNVSKGIHSDQNRDSQLNFPLDLSHQQERWRPECLRRLPEAFKLPSDLTVPSSHKTAEKFTFTKQPEHLQSCCICGISAKTYSSGPIQDGSIFQENVYYWKGSPVFCTDVLLKFWCREWTVIVKGLKNLRKSIVILRLDKIH